MAEPTSQTADRAAMTRPVSPVDAMWLEMDRPNNLMVITSVVFLESTPDWQQVERLIDERVVARYPVFRQRPVRGLLRRLSWTDDEDFDLARHVHRVSLPPEGDAALQALIGERAAQQFDWAHPLWEVCLVDGYGSGAALVCRTHHALADGLALARVLLSLTEDEQGRTTVDVGDADGHGPTEQGREPPWPLAVLASGVVAPGVEASVRLGRLGWQATQALARPTGVTDGARLAWRTAQVAGTLLFSSNPPNPLSGDPALSKRVVWSRPLALTGLKELGRLSGATLNDVLISAAVAALHSYQVERDVTPVDLITMVPVNLRPLDRPLPRTLGNEFALVLLTLPSAIGEPLARLAETKRRMDWIKDSPEPALTYGLINAIGLLGSNLGRPVVDFFANKAIGVTTNVRGPDTVRYLAGIPVTGVLGWVPGSGRQTLGICIFTYAGTVQVGFLSDTSVVPDPERLLAAFEDELDLLVHLGRRRRRSGTRDRRGRSPASSPRGRRDAH